MKQGTHSPSVSKKVQLVFIFSALVYWLVFYVYLGIQLLSQPGYYSHGTVTYQITVALFPLALFITSLILVGRRWSYQRLFKVVLIAVIGMMLWSSITALIGRLWPSVFLYSWGDGSGYWAAFGKTWLEMIIGWLVFAAVLFFIHIKHYD